MSISIKSVNNNTGKIEVEESDCVHVDEGDGLIIPQEDRSETRDQDYLGHLKIFSFPRLQVISYC